MELLSRAGIKLWGRLLTALTLTLMLCPHTGFAAVPGDVLFNEEFEAESGSGPYPGYHGSGWGLAPAQDRELIPGYLTYPVEGLFSNGSGSIDFVVQRDDRGENPKSLQTVLCIVNSSGIPVFRFYLAWKTTRPGDTVIYLNGLDSFLPVQPNASVNLGRIIDEGEWVHFLFSWDRKAGYCRLYANGIAYGEWIFNDDESVDASFALAGRDNGSAHRKITMPAQLGHLVVGAVPFTENPILGSSPLVGSVVDQIRVHRDPKDPGNLIRVDSVSHNAFRSAGYSGKLVAGDVFDVTVKGEPYLDAWCDIGDIANIPLSEDPGEPGTYRIRYTVGGKDGVFDGPVTARITSTLGLSSCDISSRRNVVIDSRVYLQVESESDLIPADEHTVTGISVVATDANGKAQKNRELKLTLSTTDEYTGLVGSGTFGDLVGSELDVEWGGVTDSFGGVTAEYMSGFAAKTVLVSAKDMESGDVGVGYIRSFIEGSVDIVVTRPMARKLSAAGSMDVTLSRDWLTADGRSRSRITAVVRDASRNPVSGHNVVFTLLGSNGSIRTVQGYTDTRGQAYADYIAGTVMGQVLVEVRDTTAGRVSIVAIELRPDAPAKIVLSAHPGEVVAGGETLVTARVSDANGNPNSDVDVLYDVMAGHGDVSSASVATDSEGVASVVMNAGASAGIVTVRGTVISRTPAAEEIDAAFGAVFLYGLEEDPGRLDVVQWLVEPGDEVSEGQILVTLEGRTDDVYTVSAPRDGTMSVFWAEERDRVQYGDTLGYVLGNTD